MLDIRILDGDDLIASKHVEDNVIAVLARLRDEREAVRRILQKIARIGRESRSLAIDELTLLAGLRQLEPLIQWEAMHMPILNDIMDHQVYGPLLREGREEGRRELFLEMVADRFGPVPPKLKKQITALSMPRLNRMARNIFRADSIEDLLKKTPISTNGKSAIRARK